MSPSLHTNAEIRLVFCDVKALGLSIVGSEVEQGTGRVVPCPL